LRTQGRIDELELQIGEDELLKWEVSLLHWLKDALLKLTIIITSGEFSQCS
jgi:hypothetical protein